MSTLQEQAEALGITLGSDGGTSAAGTTPPRRRGGRPRKERCIRGHLMAETRGPSGCRECARIRERERYRARRAGLTRAEALDRLVQLYLAEYEAILRGEM
jgi:hypothetical protein